MEIIQAAILGVVQGLTEFLPISSSAHLYLVPFFFGWDYQGLQFDVALHWGTLLAVVWIFWRDYLEILKSPKMIGYLVLGSVPAGLAGFLLRDQIETVFRNPIVTVFTLSGFALLLWLADKKIQTESKSDKSQLKKIFFDRRGAGALSRARSFQIRSHDHGRIVCKLESAAGRALCFFAFRACDFRRRPRGSKRFAR